MNSADAYENWLNDNYDELVCLAAETGQDREVGFDWEKFVLREYAKFKAKRYLESTHDQFMKIFNEAPDRGLPEGVLTWTTKSKQNLPEGVLIWPTKKRKQS